MPKEAKKSEKEQEDSSKENEEEFEELIEEPKEIDLVGKIPKRIKIKKQEEIIDQEKFVEFLQNQEDTSPSLKRDQDFGPRSLETGIVMTQGFQESNNQEENKQDDPFKYSVGSNLNQNEPKYTNTSEIETIRDSIVRDVSKLSDQSEVDKRRVGFTPSPEYPSSEKNNFEKYDVVKSSDIKDIEKRSDIQKREIKYTPSKS